MNTISKHFSIVIMVLLMAGIQACSYYDNNSTGSCPDGSLATVEIAGDLIDNDCDGEIDEGDKVDEGDGSLNEETDDDADGFTETEGDCDDADASIHPGATEVVDNGVDEDCNGSDLTSTPPEVVDCTDSEATIYYRDSDGDGYGTSDLSALDATNASCEDSPPAGYASNNTDCNDASFVVHPGMMDYSCPLDGTDNDCDGEVDNGISLCLGGGDEEEVPPETDATYITKLRFDIQNLGTVGIAGITSTNWNAVKIGIKLGTSELLCSMSDAGIPRPSVAGANGDPGNDGDWYSFTLDMADYLTCASSSITANNYDEILQLENIRQIKFVAGNTETTWGIERLRIRAIFSDNSEQFFYKNYGVWAYLQRNNQVSRYPEIVSNCGGNGAQGGFINFPSPEPIDGTLNYDMFRMPNAGELIFSPTDTYYRVSLSTDNALSSGALKDIMVRFDCLADSGNIKLFQLENRNETKTVRFYSHTIPASSTDDVRVSLGDSTPNDILRLTDVSIKGWQAWSTNGRRDITEVNYGDVFELSRNGDLQKILGMNITEAGF